MWLFITKFLLPCLPLSIFSMLIRISVDFETHPMPIWKQNRFANSKQKKEKLIRNCFGVVVVLVPTHDFIRTIGGESKSRAIESRNTHKSNNKIKYEIVHFLEVESGRKNPSYCNFTFYILPRFECVWPRTVTRFA